MSRALIGKDGPILLTACPELEVLRSEWPFSEDVSLCPKLRKIAVSGDDTVDLTPFADLPALASLSVALDDTLLEFGNLTSLSARSDYIINYGCPWHLLDLPALKRLSLEKCKLDVDEDVRALFVCTPQLESLRTRQPLPAPFLLLLCQADASCTYPWPKLRELACKRVEGGWDCAVSTAKSGLATSRPIVALRCHDLGSLDSLMPSAHPGGICKATCSLL